MKGKIITRIAEGLGNQLFMYANSYALSKKFNYDFFIDNESGYFQKKNIRSFQLDNFNIEAAICDQKYKFNNNLRNTKRKFLIKLDIFKKKKNFLIEPIDEEKKTKYTSFDLNTYSDILFIEGYYESENYFKNYKTDLIKQFTLKNELIFQDNSYYHLIKKHNNIVSICVRQNRFSERKSNKYDEDAIFKSENFTKSTIDYIYRAVNYVDKKISNPKYLLWSNDFSNLRNYFPSHKFTFIENKSNKSLTDFYLLLNCKNFIVGPTSFHWWPAWLNENKNSLILRPKDINISNNFNFWPNHWISI